MILLITGMMASGKSTIAQAVAERLDKCVHLRGDAFRKMIVSGRAEMGADSSSDALAQLRLRYALAAQAATTYAESGFSVIYQDVVIGPMLSHVHELFGARLSGTIVLCPTLEAIEARERNREKDGYNDFSIGALYEVFRETPRSGYWLDNSDLSIEETSDRVLSYIEAGCPSNAMSE